MLSQTALLRRAAVDENVCMTHIHAMPRVTTGLWSAMSKAADAEIEQERKDAARARVCEMTFETSYASLDDFETLGEPDWQIPSAEDDFGVLGH